MPSQDRIHRRGIKPMTKEERKKADRFLQEIWNKFVGTPEYEENGKAMKKKFMLVQDAIWSDPHKDT